MNEQGNVVVFGLEYGDNGQLRIVVCEMKSGFYHVLFSFNSDLYIYESEDIEIEVQACTIRSKALLSGHFAV